MNNYARPAQLAISKNDPRNIENLIIMAKQYPGRFQVKSVIENEKDFQYVLDASNDLISAIGEINFPWILTPAYNTREEFPTERVLSIVELNERLGRGRFRVIVQQHKWLHGPDTKSV